MFCQNATNITSRIGSSIRKLDTHGKLMGSKREMDSMLHGSFHRKTIPVQSKLFPQHVLAAGEGGPYSAKMTEKGYNFSHSEKNKKIIDKLI